MTDRLAALERRVAQLEERERFRIRSENITAANKRERHRVYMAMWRAKKAAEQHEKWSWYEQG